MCNKDYSLSLLAVFPHCTTCGSATKLQQAYKTSMSVSVRHNFSESNKQEHDDMWELSKMAHCF